MASIQKADDAFNVMMGGKATADTTGSTDTTAVASAATQNDTSGKLSEELVKTGDTSKINATTTRKSLGQYISFFVNPQNGQAIDNWPDWTSRR
jgi:hypothetical protein